MSQTPGQWYEAAAATVRRDGYRPFELAAWSTWPFRADGSVKPLEPPAAEESPRSQGAAGCRACQDADENPDVVWCDDLFALVAPRAASLPVALFLMPRRHADLQDLTRAEAARMGELLAGVERAATTALAVPRVQAMRWGDGSEHLHWWILGRPSGALQLRGTALALWDDVLPLRDPDLTRADAMAVAAELVRLAGGRTTGTPEAVA